MIMAEKKEKKRQRKNPTKHYTEKTIDLERCKLCPKKQEYFQILHTIIVHFVLTQVLIISL